MVMWFLSDVDDILEITAPHVFRTWPRWCHTHAFMLAHLLGECILWKHYAVLDGKTPAGIIRSERCTRWQKSSGSNSGECLLFCVSFLFSLLWVRFSLIPPCLVCLCPFCLLSRFLHLLPRLPVIRINLVMVSVLSITQMAMARILKTYAYTSSNSISLFKCYSTLPECVNTGSLNSLKCQKKGAVEVMQM